ncbi:Golgi complex component 7-domain-containing protein [Cerioporus squamosus]|nr:Golgi complex component 7-domain-containing protein [Cerioporus squamosus]
MARNTAAQKYLNGTSGDADEASHTLASSSDVLRTLEEQPDVVSWINDILGVSEEPTDTERSAALTELDRRVSQLVGTLEISSEDTSAEVDRLIEDISRGASRLTYDLHFMRESALSLQGILHTVESKSKSSLGAETDAALEKLHHLDTVKRNMEATREVLREAESWSTLESDVTSLLGEKNYEKAAERLSEASKSMAVFENTPEYESRRTLMVSLQNQLEASLSSDLVAAVNSQDVAVCRNYFSIFRNIQRESEFRNYYYGSRRGPLVEEWQRAQLRDCDLGSPVETSSLIFATYLPSFYSSFLTILQTERTSVPAIFPDPRPTLSALITSTLSALQPSFSQRLEALSTHYGAVALPQLIAAYRATEDFALSADKILEKVSYATPIPGDGDKPPGAHLRRRSSARMSLSMSRRVGSHRASISGTGALVPPTLDWDQELFEPFVDFQVDYATLETRFVEDALKTALSAETRGRTDHARLLRERAVDIFGVAEEAIARCTAFTHGYGALGLVQSVDRLFAAFADASKVEINTRRSGQTAQSLTASASGEDLSDLDYTADDWADIQALLHFLEAVRTLLDRMVMFESKLRSSLIQMSTSLRQQRSDPAGVFMSGANRGKLQLLMQSSLNSSELQELLNKIDPEPSGQQAGSRSDVFLAPTPPTPDPRRSPHAFPVGSLAPPLLLSARSAISDLARTCQQALQDTILSPLHKYLAFYASSSLWSTPGDPKAKRVATGGSAISEVQVPTFSLSPSSTMQHVAEGLLNLPRLFEVYADDDALAFSLETLPFISTEFLRGLAEPAPTPDATLSSSGISHSRRSPSLSLKASAVAGGATPAVPPILSPEAVSAAWLSSLGLSLVSELTSDVLPRISKLTPAGAAQLASDLGYLSNIVMALNVEPPELEKWREWVDVDDFDGRQKLKEAREALAPGEKEDGVMTTVARLRGWV